MFGAETARFEVGNSVKEGVGGDDVVTGIVSSDPAPEANVDEGKEGSEPDAKSSPGLISSLENDGIDLSWNAFCDTLLEVDDEVVGDGSI